jgi:hypothetical protein
MERSMKVKGGHGIALIFPSLKDENNLLLPSSNANYFWFSCLCPTACASFSKKRECHLLRPDNIKVLSFEDAMTLFFNGNNQ